MQKRMEAKDKRDGAGCGDSDSDDAPVSAPRRCCAPKQAPSQEKTKKKAAKAAEAEPAVPRSGRRGSSAAASESDAGINDDGMS